MADKSNDPVALWQNMIGEMEKGFNAFANQAMASPQFSKVVNQVGGATAGAQKQLGELMEKYLLSMNLPSRAQMVGMAERLQSIEGQLNEIKAMLHQMQGNAPTRPPARQQLHGRRAPSAHRLPAENQNEGGFRSRSGRSRLCFDPGADPVRGSARDPAQHQGRRIYLDIGAVTRLDPKGHSQ